VLGFVDPKGLTLGARGGWSDSKVVCTLYIPHVVERQLAASGQEVEFAGRTSTFRVRGVLVSTSSLASLSAQAKFNVRDDEGRNASPGAADFRRSRIVFPRTDTSHIDDVLQLLCRDSTLDHLLAVSATLFDNSAYFTPSGKVEHDLALRHQESPLSESEFVAAVICYYLRPDSKGHHGAWASKNRRRQLMDYTSDGKWRFGGEKVSDIRDHGTPCEDSWKQETEAGKVRGGTGEG